MSRLAQLKREARRLLDAYRISHADHPLSTLAEAQHLVARMNSYANWHDLATDQARQTPPAPPPADLEVVYRGQAATAPPLPARANLVLRQPRPHYPKITCHEAPTGRPGTMDDPELLYGGGNLAIWGAGGGTSTMLQGFAAGLLGSDMGVIYFDGRGSVRTLHALRLRVKGDRRVWCVSQRPGDHPAIDRKSNAIDPINPLLNDPDALAALLGTKMGPVVGAIGQHRISCNRLLGLADLEQILSIDTLRHWSKTLKPAAEYLRSIGDARQEISVDSIAKHHANTMDLRALIDLLKRYPAVFNMEPDFSFYEALREGDLVWVAINALDFSPSEIAAFLRPVAVLALSAARSLTYDSVEVAPTPFSGQYRDKPPPALGAIVVDEARLFNGGIGDLLLRIFSRRPPVYMLCGVRDQDEISPEACYFFDQHLFLQDRDNRATPDRVKALVVNTVAPLPGIWAHQSRNCNCVRCLRPGMGYYVRLAERRCEEVSMEVNLPTAIESFRLAEAR